MLCTLFNSFNTILNNIVQPKQYCWQHCHWTIWTAQHYSILILSNPFFINPKCFSSYDLTLIYVRYLALKFYELHAIRRYFRPFTTTTDCMYIFPVICIHILLQNQQAIKIIFFSKCRNIQYPLKANNTHRECVLRMFSQSQVIGNRRNSPAKLRRMKPDMAQQECTATWTFIWVY